MINKVYIIVDNVLDTYNIGSIFRLADAISAELVCLCGDTETPPNSRILKASEETVKWVPWKYFPNTLMAISYLRKEVPGIQIASVEIDSSSVPYDTANLTPPIALIVSHETHGATKEVLRASDIIVELPMFGINTSLNVMVSLAIVLYKVILPNTGTEASRVSDHAFKNKRLLKR